MASASIPTRTSSRPVEPVVAVVAVLLLALWPVEIHKAFGLPAHPLILHVPVIFVPLLGLAAIGYAIRPRERYALPLAVFSVATMAATLLTVGAGEAFQDDRARTMPGGGLNDPTLQDHIDAGHTLRLSVILLTAVLVAFLFARRWPAAANTTLRVLAVLLAAVSVVFVIRTGHLGAKMAWGREGQGPPPGFDSGQGFPGGQPPQGTPPPQGG
jgi:hypothetical protein